ncbi:hypothetical protein [Enterocloster bolteae]|nr:hypothetical protein [Enterocloster bolteae]MDU1141458.1 hypothetical protein [Enterocloster bolteae]
MIKKGSKQSKVSRIDRSKALAAPKGVIWYYETMLHRQRASRV